MKEVIKDLKKFGSPFDLNRMVRELKKVHPSFSFISKI